MMKAYVVSTCGTAAAALLPLLEEDEEGEEKEKGASPSSLLALLLWSILAFCSLYRPSVMDLARSARK